MPIDPSGANPNRQRLRLIQYERLRSSAPLELIAEDLRHLPGLAFIANGVTGHSYLTADPYAWVDWLPGQPEGDALARLSDLVLAGHGEVPAGPVPFSGGAIGQIEYEAGYCFDRIRNCRAPAGRRLMRFGLYGWVIAHDEGKGETWLIVNGADPRPQTGLSDRRSLLTALRTRRRAIPSIRSIGAMSDFTRSGYMQTVEQVQRYIAAGDVYQVNIARRLSGRLGADPWNVFLRLRRSGTDPMAAIFEPARPIGNFSFTRIAVAPPKRGRANPADQGDAAPWRGPGRRPGPGRRIGHEPQGPSRKRNDRRCLAKRPWQDRRARISCRRAAVTDRYESTDPPFGVDYFGPGYGAHSGA